MALMKLGGQSKKMSAGQLAELKRKQNAAKIPAAPKNHMTDDVVTYLRKSAATQSSNAFAETLATILKEPK